MQYVLAGCTALTVIIKVNTIIMVQIKFDPAKDVINIRNHGLSLSVARDIEWDLLLSHADNTRHDYYEPRMIGFAPIGSVVYCVVFVEREVDLLRIISLRKATKAEVQSYVKNQN